MSNHPCPSLHLYKNLFWGAENSHVQDEPKPHLQAHIAAAHRDARVSVLLDAYFDNQDLNNPRSDLRTVEYLTSMAQAYEPSCKLRQLIASARPVATSQASSRAFTLPTGTHCHSRIG